MDVAHEVNIIDATTSTSVMVKTIGFKVSGAETANANDTAPRIPHELVNNKCSAVHLTPQIRIK